MTKHVWCIRVEYSPLHNKNKQTNLSVNLLRLKGHNLICYIVPLYCGNRLILKTALRKCQVPLPRQEVCDKLEAWYKTEVMMTLSRA